MSLKQKIMENLELKLGFVFMVFTVLLMPYREISVWVGYLISLTAIIGIALFMRHANKQGTGWVGSIRKKGK